MNESELLEQFKAFFDKPISEYYESAHELCELLENLVNNFINDKHTKEIIIDCIKALELNANTLQPLRVDYRSGKYVDKSEIHRREDNIQTIITNFKFGEVYSSFKRNPNKFVSQANDARSDREFNEKYRYDERYLQNKVNKPVSTRASNEDKMTRFARIALELGAELSMDPSTGHLIARKRSQERQATEFSTALNASEGVINEQ